MNTQTETMTAAEMIAHLGGIEAIRTAGEKIMIWTMEIGDWPGGPAWILPDEELDEGAPEIVAIVELVGKVPGNFPEDIVDRTIGIYDWETVRIIPSSLHAHAEASSDTILADWCERQDELERYAADAARHAAHERWRKTVPPETVETVPAQLPAIAKAFWSTAREYDGKRGLTIVGATGSGKSRIASRALLACCLRGASIHWLGCAELRTRMLASIDGASRIYNQATGPRVLVLDDIGHGLGMEQADALLLSILTYRTNHRRPTIVTTQFSAAAIIARFATHETGEAVVRRIGQQYNQPWDFGKSNQGGTEP